MITVVMAYIAGLVSGFFILLLLIRIVLKTDLKKHKNTKRGSNRKMNGSYRNNIKGQYSNVIYLSDYIQNDLEPKETAKDKINGIVKQVFMNKSPKNL